MPVELKILALGALLLFIHIFTATRFKTAQYGRTWNVGARDETLPAPNPVTGRTMRAQANFQETFPIAIVALLGVVLANRTSEWTALGGWIWLGTRVVSAALRGRRSGRSHACVCHQHGRPRHGAVAAARRARLEDAQRPQNQARAGARFRGSRAS